MAHVSDLIATDIDRYLVSHQNKTIHGTPYNPELASTPEYRAAA